MRRRSRPKIEFSELISDALVPGGCIPNCLHLTPAGKHLDRIKHCGYEHGMLGLRTAGNSLVPGELGDGKDHHAGKELHSSHIVIVKGVRGGGEHFEDSQRLLKLA